MPSDLFIDFLGQPPFSWNDSGDGVPRRTEGAEKLGVQFFFHLFTELGTDPQDDERGSELPRLIGANVSDLQEVSDVITIAVDRVTQWMRELQRAQNLPEDERLQSATVAGVYYTASNDGVGATIVVQNALGDGVPLNIEV